MSGRWVELEQLLDRVDHLRGPAAPADSNGQAEAAVLVVKVQEFEGPPIQGLDEQNRSPRRDVDTQLVAAAACLQEDVIAYAGAAGAVAAPPPARSVAPSCR